MANRRDALGKGLGALIPEVDSMKTAGTTDYTARTGKSLASISEIPVDKITANPYQPRNNFDETALSELTESIRQLGIIQPITVRRMGLGYQIISGERRFKAARAAGLRTIPAYIRETDNQGMLEMAIVENIQREDLDAIEVALSFQCLIGPLDGIGIDGQRGRQCPHGRQLLPRLDGPRHHQVAQAVLHLFIDGPCVTVI